MFDVQIKPILEYASEVWYHGKEISELEKIQLRYMKGILKVKQSTSTHAIMAECGRFPMYVKQKFQAVKYWKRVLEMNNNHIVKKAYNSTLELHEVGQTNWCSHIKSILHEVEYQQAWIDQNLDNRNLGIIKEKIYNQYMTSCMDDISNSETHPKLRTYKLFKSHFKLEPYLMCTQNLNFNLALLKFRISSHNLRIETGRYTRPSKTPVDERLCLYCSNQAVEDETHFLLNCTLYSEERTSLESVIKKYIVTNFHGLTEIEKFVLIMSSDTPAVIEALGRFVYSCFKKRNSLDLH